MELVTGRKGEAHVTSQQDRMLHQGVFGTEAYILNTGKKLKPEVQSSNEIRIRDGALMVQGALSCVKINTYDSITIQNGTQGMKRIDLIVWQYMYNAESDTEYSEWNVIQGMPDENEPHVPEYVQGDIQIGDNFVQVPYLAVHLDGINITEVEMLLEVIPDIYTTNKSLTNSVDELNRKFVFKRRNSSEAGICTPHYIMIMGTLVLQGANADYRQLFTTSDLLSKLKFYDPSISNFEAAKCVVTTNNGDGNAAATHFYAPEWWGSNNAYYQYFYPATSSQIRVNYCIHYLKL